MYNEDELLYLKITRIFKTFKKENINRMATNSTKAKTWMISTVSAFFAIQSCMVDFRFWLLFSLIPIFCFWYYDGYYLQIERGLRNRERYFVNLKNETETSRGIEKLKTALFDFTPYPKDKDDLENGYRETKTLMFNKSVCPLYVLLMIAVLIVTIIANL